MTSFTERLQAKIRQTGNPVVMGLDPLLSYIPEHVLDGYRQLHDDPFIASGQAILTFNQRLIDQVHDLVPAIKPQLAYYEQYGLPGLEALQQTIRYAQSKEMLVILDGKRNDIGSTAEAYARAYLGRTEWIDHSWRSAFEADALTVNAYLGIDGIQPFLSACRDYDKGIFILVRTSNPSAGDLQDLLLADGRPVYMAMAELVNQWGLDTITANGYAAVGAVVGATWPSQAAELRKAMPHAWILVPGYGAQGATAEDCMASFDEAGSGAIVNASRSLMCAWRKHEMDIDQFDLAARREAMAMREDLQQALEKSGRPHV